MVCFHALYLAFDSNDRFAKWMHKQITTQHGQQLGVWLVVVVVAISVTMLPVTQSNQFEHQTYNIELCVCVCKPRVEVSKQLNNRSRNSNWYIPHYITLWSKRMAWIHCLRYLFKGKKAQAGDQLPPSALTWAWNRQLSYWAIVPPNVLAFKICSTHTQVRR